MSDSWLHTVIQYVLAPFFSGFMGFMLWLYKKQQMKIDELEHRVIGVEKSNAVIEVKIDGMKEDIKDIKEGVKQLVERQINIRG